MALAKYPMSVTRAIEQTEVAATAARKVKNDTGDLTFRLLAKVFNDMERMEALWRTAIADMNRGYAADVDNFLASIGGPGKSTLIGQLTTLKQAKDAFGDALRSWLHNQPASLLVDVPTLTDADGNTYRELQWGSHVSDPTAQTLRDSPPVFNLVAAFDALGV